MNKIKDERLMWVLRGERVEGALRDDAPRTAVGKVLTEVKGQGLRRCLSSIVHQCITSGESLSSFLITWRLAYRALSLHKCCCF
jgi:hypothetical protein